MSVVAALIFYRQTAERLERCVRSLHGRCDGIVALDGPFRGLSAELQSPEDNYHAIMAASRGMPCHIFEGQEWSGEPQKRTAAARAALDLHRESFGDTKPWVLVIDSDEWLESDIDWDVVNERGHGSGQMVSYRWPARAENEGGDGSRMVRLVPNSEHLLWGPAHFDLRDMSGPVTYTGWEKALLNTDTPAFKIGHDLGEKVIEAEYETYNDRARLFAEGRMMRVVEDYSRGSRIVVRMDRESADSNGWRPGIVVAFNAGLLGTAEDGYAEVVRLEGRSDIPVYDIVMERIPKGEEQAKIRANAEVEIAKRERMTSGLQKRAQKRSRKWKGQRQGGLPR